MKKYLVTIAIVMCLLVLAGCGSKKVTASGDDTSLYPYGWQENQDGSVTVRISGKWEEDCTWQPRYDAALFEVTPEKTAGYFTVRGLTAGTGEVEFFLCRGEQETAEYCIWTYFSSSSVGDVQVLECTHEETAGERDYAYTNSYDGALLFTVYSPHEWKYRMLQQGFSMELYESSDESRTFEIRGTMNEGTAQVELWDTEAARKLIIDVYETRDGYVYVNEVTESEDTAMAESTLDSFWQELGIEATLPANIAVSDCKIVTQDSNVGTDYGFLQVTIGGNEYDYLVSDSKALKEAYTLESFVDEHDTVIEVQNDTVTLKGNINAEVSSLDDTTTVIWQNGGIYFVLCGEDVSMDAAVSAAKQIVGGGNG